MYKSKIVWLTQYYLEKKIMKTLIYESPLFKVESYEAVWIVEHKITDKQENFVLEKELDDYSKHRLKEQNITDSLVASIIINNL